MAKKPVPKTPEVTKKSTEPKAHSRVTWNDKVAKSRNKKDWRKKIMQGKSDVPLHPTLLRQLRVQSGKSQAEMAAKVSLSATTYGDVERGKRPIKKAGADTIGGLLGKTVNFLFEASELKNKFVARKAA